MILTDREIQTALEQGLFNIDPRPPEIAYSSTTVDLTLDANISEFKNTTPGIEFVINPADPSYKHEEVLAQYTRPILLDEAGYVFKP